MTLSGDRGYGGRFRPHQPRKPSLQPLVVLAVAELWSNSCVQVAAVQANADTSASTGCTEAPEARIKRFRTVAKAQPQVSDKVDAAHRYEVMYGMLLLPHLETMRRPKLLEVGLGCGMRYGAGGSAKLWRKLAPHAELWEAERNAACANAWSERLKQKEGINVLVGDQSNRTHLRQWVQLAGGAFDVIIDDGGHRNVQILTSFEELWPSLQPGGIYFMEDICVSRYSAFMTEGEQTVMVADVLQAWQEQVVNPWSRERSQQSRAWRIPRDPRWGEPTGLGPSLREAIRRHPLPQHARYIFCQNCACAIGKL